MMTIFDTIDLKYTKYFFYIYVDAYNNILIQADLFLVPIIVFISYH